MEQASTEPIRLQKLLSAAGVASRRASEEMIVRGRVSVNGKPVTELGTKVSPSDRIEVDGKRVHTDTELRVFAFHKPEGVVCTMQPEDDRPCVGDYVTTKLDGRYYHVGRLDAATEGLLLLTNHGELAHRLMHPSWEVPKTYTALVQGKVRNGLGKVLRDGVELEDGWANVDKFRILELRPKSSIVELTLHSGQNRVVRRMLSAVDHPVTRLVRIQHGPVRLADLRPGAMRPLNGAEMAQLLQLVQL